MLHKVGRTFSLIALTMILALAAAACGAGEQVAPAATLGVALGEGGAVGGASTLVPNPTAAMVEPADAIKTGGILKQAHRRSPLHFRLDVDSATDQISNTIPLFNQLITLQPNGFTAIGPDLAETWDVSEDGLTFTFNLASNVINHNGNPWTSKDAKFTLETLALTTENRPPHLTVSVGGVSTLEKIETPDDNTLIVTLNQLDGLFLSNLSQGWASMYTEADYDENGSLDDPVGTGPFFLQNHRVGEKLEFRKHEQYFRDGLPYLDGFDMFIIRDTAAKLAAFEAQRIDIVLMGSSHGFFAENLQQVADRHPGEITFYAGQHTVSRGVKWNWAQEGPWQDIRVRQAINLAIDRDQVCLAIPSCIVGGWVPSATYGITDRDELAATPGFARTGPDKDAEIAEAKRLLADAGFPDGFEVESLCRDTADYRDQFCPVMEFMLRDTLNIRLELDVQESGAWTEKQDSADWLFETGSAGSARIDHPFDWLDYVSFCGEDPQINITNYCNEDLDELLRQLRVATGTDELKALSDQAVEIMNDELPYVIVFWPARWPVHWNYVMNAPDEHFSGQYSQARRLEEVWLDK